MRERIIKVVEKVLIELNIIISVELIPAKKHGDFSTNIAMKIAKKFKKNPIEIANKLRSLIKDDFILKIEVASPGFINIFLTDDAFASIIKKVNLQDKNFGKDTQGRYINIEYVSANPTGYLHLGHARGAALGASLSNILKFAGNKVDQEYYINDAGNQIDTLGMAVFTRYQQLLKVDVSMPEDTYKGDDIIDVAKVLLNFVNDKYKHAIYSDVQDIFKHEAKKYLLKKIKEDLKSFGVEFDIFSSEKDLYETHKIEPSLDKLSDYTYQSEGALWLKTQVKGDDKDRVLIKANGKYTYLAPDIAYHSLKLERGYDELINIWGVDHSGYIKRMQIALEYLGLANDKLDVLTIELVKLIKNGTELKMSKRLGTSFTLKELINLVGTDASRFYMIDRSNNSGVDFDVDFVVKKSADNPVFTIQYAHARTNQLLKKGINLKVGKYEKIEKKLITTLAKFPKIIQHISFTHKVHLLPQYLIDVAREFNSFYSNSKIIGTKREAELLALVKATKIVLHNGLELIGVSAPNKM